MMSLEINSSRAQAILKKAFTITNETKNASVANNNKKKNQSCVNPNQPKARKLSTKTKSVVKKNKRSEQSEESEYKALVGKILHTVFELEHYLVEDHQQDYKLRMALERQKERACDLSTSLANEKRRNKRLVNLIRSVDSVTSEEELVDGDRKSNEDKAVRNSREVIQRWPLNAYNEAYESISPLLMHQRYDELSTSYKQCRRQLLKKEKQVVRCKCETERLQARYDQLVEEFRTSQKRVESVCCRYLHLQKRKNYEVSFSFSMPNATRYLNSRGPNSNLLFFFFNKIHQLRETLTHANGCIHSAQLMMDKGDHSKHDVKEFNQNLQQFVRSLQLCNFTTCGCNSIASQEK
uniref:Uncharacterized protein n=1 Tax=Glossina brevipalpis TaxID=37001 RepID=A0A1A9WYW5_9MUSC